MTINHIYNIIVKAMDNLQDIDFINLDKRKYNQEQINKVYNVLDSFKDELIRENIKTNRRRYKRDDKRRISNIIKRI